MKMDSTYKMLTMAARIHENNIEHKNNVGWTSTQKLLTIARYQAHP